MADFDLQMSAARLAEALLPDDELRQQRAVASAIRRDGKVEASALPAIGWYSASGHLSGAVTAGSNQIRWAFPQGGVIRRVSFDARVAPNGGAFEFTIIGGNTSESFSLQAGETTEAVATNIVMQPGAWARVNVTSTSGVNDVVITLQYSLSESSYVGVGSSGSPGAGAGSFPGYGGDGSATTVSRSDHTHAGYVLTSSLAGVALSGAYADLTGKPTIPTTLAALDTTVTGSQLDAIKTKVDGIAAGATANASDAALRSRATHTGTQSADTIIDGSINKVYTGGDKVKLASIQGGAEVNVQPDWAAVSGDAAILNKPAAMPPIAHTQPASTITDFSAAADARIAAQKAIANGLATLDASGKLPSSQIPAIGLTDVHVVASQSAQLALTAQEGAVAIRTDLNLTYIHNGGTAGTMADWSQILAPTGGGGGSVTSVNGKTGTVSLLTTDIDEGANLYYTEARVSANTDVAASKAASHTHTNKSTLDATTAAFTTALRTKLDGVAAGAEVNVQSNWNASSGDAHILNKPAVDTIGRVQNQGNTVGSNDVAVIIVQPGLLLTPDTGFVYIGPDWDGSGGDLGTTDRPARSNHIHDARYYKQSEVDAAIASVIAALPKTLSARSTANVAVASGTYHAITAAAVSFTGLVPSTAYTVKCDVSLMAGTTGRMGVLARVDGATTVRPASPAQQDLRGGNNHIFHEKFVVTVNANASGVITITPEALWVSGSYSVWWANIAATVQKV